MTKNELKQYILRKLGSPVINIEISDDQINDCINEAVDKFIEFHYDGTDIGYIFLTVETGTSSYTLDDNIHDVIDVLSPNVFSYADDPLLIKESIQFGSSGLSPFIDIVSVEVWRQNINNLQNIFNKEVLFDFNSTSKKLFLHITPTEDSIVALKVYKTETTENYTSLYSNLWLKKYCVALTKKQWATNIQKYEGAQLPGGATINYGSIMDQAQSEIEKLEEELEQVYSEPYDFFYG